MPERNNEYVYQPPAKFTEELRQRINNAGFSDEFKQQIKSAQKEEGREMFERLTRWENNDKDVADLIEKKSDFDGLTEAINRLAAYEDSGLSPEEVQEIAKAKADGRVMMLPCKPGDKVYVRSGCLFYRDNAPYTKCEVVNFRKGKKGNVRMYLRPLTESACGTNYHVIYPVSCIGLTVFLTKEAAEKALGVGE